MNLVDIIRVHAQRMPDRPALVEGGETLDWAGLQARIDAAAWHLRDHGVQAGDVVALSLRRALPGVVLALAAARIGAAWLAIDFRARPAERDAVLAAIASRLLLADRATAPAPPTPTALVDERWWRTAGGAALPAVTDDPALPAVLILSSGTTGQPKAASVSHEAAAWRGTIRAQEAGLLPGTRVLNVMSLSGSAVVSGLLANLMAGATLFLHPPLYGPGELIEQLNALDIAQVTLVPAAVRSLAGLGGDSPLLPRLDRLFVLGSAFHAEEKQAALARVTPFIFDHYGAATAGPIATATPAALARNPATVGYPAPFVRVEIVDEEGRPLPAGTTGRIRVRTPGAATGHVGSGGADGRGERLLDGWVYPGDLGRLGPDGLLFIEGRAGSVIICGGQNLYPEEIERVLLTHPSVLEAAVVGRNDERLGEVPVALVVARPGLRQLDLETHCRTRLQAAKVPAEFRFVEALPKTETGKIRRADLAALAD